MVEVTGGGGITGGGEEVVRGAKNSSSFISPLIKTNISSVDYVFNTQMRNFFANHSSSATPPNQTTL